MPHTASRFATYVMAWFYISSSMYFEYWVGRLSLLSYQCLNSSVHMSHFRHYTLFLVLFLPEAAAANS